MNSYDVQKLVNIAYINTQTTAALVELEMMKAANTLREIQGYTIAYDEVAFYELIEKYQLGHNSVMSNIMSGM